MESSDNVDMMSAQALPAVPTSSEATPPDRRGNMDASSSDSGVQIVTTKPITELPPSPRAMPSAVATRPLELPRRREYSRSPQRASRSQAKALADRGSPEGRGRPREMALLPNGAGQLNLQMVLRMHEEAQALADQRAMLMESEMALAAQHVRSEAQTVNMLRAELVSAAHFVSEASAAVDADRARGQRLESALAKTGSEVSAARAVAETEAARAQAQRQEAYLALEQTQAQMTSTRTAAEVQSGNAHLAVQAAHSEAQIALAEQRQVMRDEINASQQREVQLRRSLDESAAHMLRMSQEHHAAMQALEARFMNLLQQQQLPAIANPTVGEVGEIPTNPPEGAAGTNGRGNGPPPPEDPPPGGGVPSPPQGVADSFRGNWGFPPPPPKPPHGGNVAGLAQPPPKEKRPKQSG